MYILMEKFYSQKDGNIQDGLFRGEKIMRNVLVIGGAGFIGSHVVDLLLKEDVNKVIVYDNFCRGTGKNLEDARKDPRCMIIKGDILHTDMLANVVSGCNSVPVRLPPL